MSAAGKTEYVGGSGFETDCGDWLQVRPDGEAQAFHLTHYVAADDLDGPGVTEYQIMLTYDDLDCLIDALMAAGSAGLDARPPQTCFDCGRDVGSRGLNEAYMIHNALWDGELGLDNTVDVLCVECLEKRLGRALTPADFTDAPINGPDAPASALLRSRRDGSVMTSKAAP